MPRVSIVVPVYNGQRTIEECVESILAQAFPIKDIELLLVDNASSDRTPKILHGYRNRAVVLHEVTKGPSAARNRGLLNATGDIVAFTDADCVVHPDWLSRLIAPLDDSTIGIVGGTILSRKPCNAIEEFGERIHDHRLAIECDSPPYAITMNWASRRTVIEEVGMFDQTLLRCEDCDLAYRIVAAGYTIVFEPSAVVYHRNERNLAGLMAEGYAHGYHAVPLLEKHAEFVRTFVRGPGRARRPAPDNDSLYWRVFNFGKATGKAMASLRSRNQA